MDVRATADYLRCYSDRSYYANLENVGNVHFKAFFFLFLKSMRISTIEDFLLLSSLCHRQLNSATSYHKETIHYYYLLMLAYDKISTIRPMGKSRKVYINRIYVYTDQIQKFEQFKIFLKTLDNSKYQNYQTSPNRQVY